MGGYCIGDCCVMDFCSDSCCVGHSPSTGCGEDSGGGRSLGHTSVSNDSVGNAKRINEELNQMKEEFENKAAAQEQMLIDQINASMDKFIDELETMNNQKFSGRALNINIKAIREKRQDLSKEVVGFIGTRLYDRIVTTDPELAPMLKEKDDKKRNANVKKFCEKVLREAKNDLKTQIRITIEAQQQVVRDVLENRLTEINKSLEKSTEAYQEILSAVEKDNVEQERLKLQYMYEYDVYNVLADEMGKFDDIKVGVRSNGNKSRSGSKASESLLLKVMSDLIECNKAVFYELNTIKQAQRDMHRKLQEISLKVEAINPEELSEISKQVKKLQLMAEGVEESARLIMLTSVMNELDEVVGNK